MTLEQEMELWEVRSNDEFGTLLKKIKESCVDFFVAEEDEFGMKSTPLDTYIALYSLDGNRKYIANSVKGILWNYDILGNYKNIEKLVNKLFTLI